MTPLLPNDFVGKCVRHFEHACEKHPKFANEITTMSDILSCETALEIFRDSLDSSKQVGCLAAEELLDCEEYEAYVEYLKGNIPAAIEELYDAIAVLMRTICVLEGKQELAKEVCE